jgi:hypothetical protein
MGLFYLASRLNLGAPHADRYLPGDCTVRIEHDAASIIQLGGVVHCDG